MLTYYRLVKNEKKIYFYVSIFFFFVALTLHIYDENLFFHLLSSLFFFIALYLFLLSGMDLFLSSSAVDFLEFILIIISLFFIISWTLERDIYLFGIIDDSKMLVLATFIYVFLTYKILKSNYEIFQYQRMPYLKIEMENSCRFRIINISDFAAENIVIKIEVVYPHRIGLSALKLWLSRSLEKVYCLLMFQTPTYIFGYNSEFIETKNHLTIDISNELLTRLPIKKQFVSEHDFEIYSNEEFEFEVIISYSYSSCDKLKLETPLYRVFLVKCDPKGTYLNLKSGEALKIENRFF